MSTQLNANEINALIEIISLASSKGAFKGADLPAAGHLWAKLTTMHTELQQAEEPKA